MAEAIIKATTTHMKGAALALKTAIKKGLDGDSAGEEKWLEKAADYEAKALAAGEDPIDLKSIAV